MNDKVNDNSNAVNLSDNDLLEANNLKELCSAMNNAFKDVENGHGVLIDDSGFSLIQRSYEESPAETLIRVGTARELYNQAKKLISEA